MAAQYKVPTKQNLKAVRIFDAVRNTQDSAIFDTDTNLVIGFSADRPYYPVGGFEAIEMIVNDGGLVPGSEVWGFECEHLHDEVYRLVDREAA